ncbi:hypothetical protein FY048_01550 [Acinetobacter sp. 1124_18A]|uniref:hypothetical protein n=1 Tax=Acinetobacter sp. 1124_18A TaxID=2605958 RepID=UPI00405827BF
MRNEITQVGVVASRSANRIYDEKVNLFFNEIKQKEGKEVFASTIILRAGADLYNLLGEDFENQLDMLVKIMKDQAKA